MRKFLPIAVGYRSFSAEQVRERITSSPWEEFSKENQDEHPQAEEEVQLKLTLIPQFPKNKKCLVKANENPKENAPARKP